MARLDEINASVAAMGGGRASIGEDPALDQFMEAYCEMLSKYEQELCKPFKEAMLFLSRIESQFKALTSSSSDSGKLNLSILCDLLQLFLVLFYYNFIYLNCFQNFKSKLISLSFISTKIIY